MLDGTPLLISGQLNGRAAVCQRERRVGPSSLNAKGLNDGWRTPFHARPVWCILLFSGKVRREIQELFRISSSRRASNV